MPYDVRHRGQRNGLIQFTTEEWPVAEDVTATSGDFVTLSGGRVTTASIGSAKLYGVVKGGRNDDLVSRNYREPVTVGDEDGTAKVLVELCEGQRYELPVGASLAADAEGSYYTLTGASGNQTVSNASKSATVGQLLCTERIPTNPEETEFRRGVFVVAAPKTQTEISA